jgi:hypothetical protein
MLRRHAVTLLLFFFTNITVLTSFLHITNVFVQLYLAFIDECPLIIPHYSEHSTLHVFKNYQNLY